MPKILIFTDLDGTLLDFYNYSFAAATPLLKTLEAGSIPVIFSSSKTAAEILELRSLTDNKHPFIVENGAALYVPKHYFQQTPEKPLAKIKGDYLCFEFVQDRSHWLHKLGSLEQKYSGAYTGFSAMNIEDIRTLTGLNEAAASLAAQREYGEPIQWHGSAELEQAFIETLKKEGAGILKGGRFLHVSGECDKGQALQWLKMVYSLNNEEQILSIAAGDSNNDAAMLEVADYSLWVRSPKHNFPQLRKIKNIFHSSLCGPEGWSEGIQNITKKISENH